MTAENQASKWPEPRYRGFFVIFFGFRIEATSSMLGSESPVAFLYLIGPGILSGRGGCDFRLAFVLALAMRLLEASAATDGTINAASAP
jgi:hypothetical protein